MNRLAIKRKYIITTLDFKNVLFILTPLDYTSILYFIMLIGTYIINIII